MKILLFGLLFWALGRSSFALENSSDFTHEKLTVTGLADGRSYELHSLLVKSNHDRVAKPLVIINHGAPMQPGDAKKFKMESDIPLAETISNFGYAVVILERRGFGSSTEALAEFSGKCGERDYQKSIRATNADLDANVKYFSSRADVNVSNFALVGHSAGGFIAVEYARSGPPGLKGVVSFAGIRGSDGRGGICDQKQMENIFREAGKSSKIPELWIFAENDHVFPPDLAKNFFKIFTQAGGTADLWLTPPFGDEGHDLFSKAGVPVWKTKVQTFFQKVFR